MKIFHIDEYLNALSNDIIELDISNKNLTNLPDLSRFYRLRILCCNINQIRQLPLLPPTLEEFNCSYNQIEQIHNLPPTLRILYCGFNQITKFEHLPHALKILHFSYNQNEKLPNLPHTLEEIYCNNNNIKSLDCLPLSIRILYCNHNQIEKLPYLPTLEMLNCCDNQIKWFDRLPHTLQILYCDDNPLPSFVIEFWKGVSKLRNTYFASKYGSRIEKYYIKNIRNKEINKNFIDILYSPYFNFYKRFIDPNVRALFLIEPK
jgi:Leucine-rich repeat (LRR) protein